MAQMKAVVTFEMSWGQMIEDVALAMYGRPRPLHFVARHGGVVFTPAEVAQEINKISADPEHGPSLWRPS